MCNIIKQDRELYYNMCNIIKQTKLYFHSFNISATFFTKYPTMSFSHPDFFPLSFIICRSSLSDPISKVSVRKKSAYWHLNGNVPGCIPIGMYYESRKSVVSRAL